MLKIEWNTEVPPPRAGQLLALPLRESDWTQGARAHGLSQVVIESMERARFRGRPGETFAITREQGDVLQHVVCFGVADPLGGGELRAFANEVVRRANALGCRELVVDLRERLPVTDERVQASELGNLVAQGLVLGTYAYERYLATDKRSTSTLESVTVVGRDGAPAEGVPRGQIVAAAVARARDLGNGPAELVNPTYLAQYAQDLVGELRSKANVSVKILERADCEKLGMGCFLGVAKGSDEPPKFIHLTYKPKGASRGRVCLVGKGVTFDSGGYSLKPTDGMLDMKMDMAGAAAVLGAFGAIAELAMPWEVHTIVAATENMVSGHAYRLGDVLRASNGKTVEINNTDAEGRLTLADALVYAGKLEPDCVLDFATLTGACMVALGPKIAGVMTPFDDLAESWLDAAKGVGEPMWRLPLPDDLKEQLKSKVADMKNTGERWGGALTAGLFLSEFTEGRRWLHVDIAGPAMASKPYGVTTAGGTGFGVASIVAFLGRP